MKGVPQDLHALADALDGLLGVSAETGERTHVIVGRDRPVSRLGLALEPWTGMEGWIRAEQLDAVLLHRPWRLPIDALPAELGVLATHAPFDERLGFGWNPALAEQLELRELVPLGPRGGTVLGMLGELAPVPWRSLLGRLEAVFGGIEACHGAPQDADRTITRAAVARAMTPDLVGEAARAGAGVYVTGQIRPAARNAVLATGLAAVAIGHARAERWSLGLLARLLAGEWPDLRLDLAPDREPPHRSQHREG